MLQRTLLESFLLINIFVHSLELLGIYSTEEKLKINKACFVLLREFILSSEIKIKKNNLTEIYGYKQKDLIYSSKDILIPSNLKKFSIYWHSTS